MMNSVACALVIRRSFNTAPCIYRDRDSETRRRIAERMGLYKDIDSETRRRIAERMGLYKDIDSETRRRIAERMGPARPFSEMPTVPVLPVLGSAWSYIPYVGRYRVDKQHLADLDKHRRYGPVVREKYGETDLVLSFNERDVRTILHKEDFYPVRSEFSSVVEYRKLRPNWYQTVGLNAMRGKEWYDLRLEAQKYLSDPSQLETYRKVFCDISTDLVRRLLQLRNANGEVSSFLQEISKWSLASQSVVAFNRRLGTPQDLHPEDDVSQLLQSMQTQLDCMSRMEGSAGSLQTWKYLPNLTWKRYVKAADKFSKIAFTYIQPAIVRARMGERSNTFLEMMVNKVRRPYHEVMVIAADVLFEGISTTSSAFTFLLYHLAKNLEKQETLYNEIVRMSEKSQSISFETLPYLAHCFREAMRLHPVSRGIARTLDHPAVISGYIVPPKVTILCITQVMGQSEAYFRNPMQFQPERWAEEEEPEFSYACLPFGANKRSCLGKTLAEFQMSLLLVELLKRCRVEYHHGKLDVQTKLINQPVGPVPFRFVER